MKPPFDKWDRATLIYDAAKSAGGCRLACTAKKVG